MKKFVADVHTHSTLRLFYGEHDIWWSQTPTEEDRTKQLFRNTQAVFSELLNSRVRLILLSLYAIEQRFMSHLVNHEYFEELIKLPGKKFERFLVDALDELVNSERIGYELRCKLAGYADGVAKNKFKEIVAQDADYFKKINEEYQFLTRSIEKDPKAKKHLMIASNFEDIKRALCLDENLDYHSTEDDVIAIVLTIEGGHCLGCGMTKSDTFTMSQLNSIRNGRFTDTGVQELFDKLKSNIRAIKNWGGGAHCPFYLTFTHHFWNQLAGHNMSIPNNMSLIFDQDKGMNKPITKLGEMVLNELLSMENGRRILIDTKHMALDVKKWYYAFVAKHNAEHPDDPIPIISSHSAVNGWETMEDSRNSDDHKKMNVRYDIGIPAQHKGMYNNWDINLSDEEILIIHQSGGLIGLNFDQRILSGPEMIAYLKEFDKPDHTEVFRSVWVEPIIANMLHIAKTVFKSKNPNKNSAWEMVAIGSDFDGLINPLDAYCYASDFEILHTILRSKLEDRKKIEPILQGQDLDKLVDGFMYKNALRFLQKHYK